MHQTGCVIFVRIIAVLAAALGACASPGQTIIYVNAAAAAGGNGTSWSGAFQDLQAGLSAARVAVASGGDAEVWVAAGTYRPATGTVPQTASFVMRSHVKMLGGFAGTESSAVERDAKSHQTILDGGGCYHVVTGTGADSTAVLDGFIITGGNASGADADGRGGGFTCEMGVSPTVRSCTFVHNTAVIRGCGVFVHGANQITFDRCRFLGNSPAQGSGAGVGLYRTGTQTGNARFLSCEFAGNSSPLGFGAGIAVASGHATLINCSFTSNLSNTASFGNGSAIEVDNSGSVTVQNCIVWGQQVMPAISTYEGGTLTITSSCIEGGQAGVFSNGGGPISYSGNIVTDPLFQQPLGADGIAGTLDDNLRLSAGSPAIDSGSTSFLASDMAQDLDGNRRLAKATPAGPLLVDLGAYEYGAPPFSPFGQILYVREGAVGYNDGSSWANAFSTSTGVRDALAQSAASFGAITEVWVAAGTYTPAPAIASGGSRSPSFQLQNGLALYGGFAGTETALSQRNVAGNPTILSGDINNDDVGSINRGDNSYHVVTATGATNAAIDGFTMTAGNASGTTVDTQRGGGLFGTSGSLSVRNCTFQSNWATLSGGGVYLTNAACTFSGCTFQSNTVTSGDAVLNEYAPGGGGMCADAGAMVRLIDCSFTGNSHSACCQGGFRFGGALCGFSGARVDVIRCSFIRNFGADSGGAIGTGPLGASVPISVVNSTFLGNSCALGGSAIAHSGFDLAVTGCLFVGNRAGDGGTVDYRNSGVVTNCTLVANEAGVGSAGIGAGFSSSVTNCILWRNTVAGNPNSTQLFGNSTFTTRSDFAAQPGAGNSGSDPILVRLPSPGPDGVWGTNDDDYGDLRLAPGSPAIDSGDSTAVPPDTYDLNGNGNTTESLPYDLLGFPRFVDDPGIANTGIGSPPVDRGCYESQVNCLACPGPREWRSPLGGAFDFIGNWFPSVPQANHDVIFDLNAAYTVTFPPMASISNQSATVDKGSVSLVLNRATYSLTSAVAPSLVVGDAVNQPASLSIAGGFVSAVEARIGSTVGSAGVLSVLGDGSPTVPSATLATTEGLCVGCQGSGVLNVTGGAHASCLFGFLGEVSGATGQVNISGAGSRLDAPFFLAIDNGSVNVSGGGLLTTGAFGAIYVFPNGSVSGDGTVQGHVVNFGRIAPGNSPGTLTINGAYDQVGTVDNLNDLSGLLQAQVAGPGAGQFDRLVVNGPATLGGGLVVTLMNNYQPSATDLIPLVTASGGLTKPFDVVFFPALSAPANMPSPYLRANYAGLRGPGGSVSIDLATLPTAPRFSNPLSLDLSNPPTGVAIADLDGDGLLDVAVTIPDAANPTTSTGVVAILHNNGGSGQGWQGFSLAAAVPVGLNPLAVATGRLQPSSSSRFVIVANSASNNLSVLKNSGGPGGTYSVVSTHATDPEPVALAAADFTGLGGAVTMVAVGCAGGAGASTGSLALLANTTTSGNPTFLPRFIPLPTGHKPRDIRPFNPDQDKDLDLVVSLSDSGGSSDALAVYVNGHDNHGNSPSGLPDISGVSTPAVMLPVDSGPGQVLGGRLRPITQTTPAGQYEDLVSINTTGNSVSVLVNTAIAQDQPQFAPAVNYHFDAVGGGGAAPAPRSAALVDLDASGTLDLAVVASNAAGDNRVVKILRNDSTVRGGVTQVAFAQQADIPAGNKPLAIVSGDVDGDGRVDLVTINSTIGRDGPSTMQVIKNALPPPSLSGGACCNGSSCSIDQPERCAGTNQRFAGSGTSCNAPGNVRTPCCKADFNHVNGANVQDIFDFLGAWFMASPQADINGDGAEAVQDIFDFLAAWFGGC